MSLITLWRRLLTGSASTEEPLQSPPAWKGALAVEVAERLRAGDAVADALFDALYPAGLRSMSRVHWTPVREALACSRLLVTSPGCRVLDIGSGAGKLCIIGALATEGHFTGIEQYAALVACARDVARAVGATRAVFTHGFFSALDPVDYDAVYLFNPFEENSWPRPTHARDTPHSARGTFEGGIAEAQAFLRGARPGTRVVTYNGMGGAMPAGYELQRTLELRCLVEVWAKKGSIRRAV